MWEELTKSVKAALYDRIASPLLGTFVVSWVLWNHRFVTVLFSGMEPASKFRFVDTVLYPAWEYVLWQMIVFPLLTTVLFIFLYPYPARIVFEFTRQQQKRLKEIRQRIEDETPLTAAESKQIRTTALQAQLLYEKDMRALTEENQLLRTELQKLLAQGEKRPKRAETQPAKVTTEPVRIGAELSEEAIKALVLLSEVEGVSYDAYIDELAQKAKISKIRAKHLYDQLIGSYVYHNNHDDMVVLNEKGRALLVTRGLA